MFSATFPYLYTYSTKNTLFSRNYLASKRIYDACILIRSFKIGLSINNASTTTKNLSDKVKTEHCNFLILHPLNYYKQKRQKLSQNSLIN